MSLEDAAAWTVGRYTIHGEIAAGGMATVHIGRQGGDAGFSKLVAVKRMHPQFAKDTDFLAMFLDEARLAARIRHPNVIQPVDVLVENGEVLLVMEYIHGEALSRINKALRTKAERIPLRIAVAIMSGVLHGLHAAHEAKNERGEPLGIVHRDISPQNIIVGTDGVARVLDFGIAKAADQVHMTREGELKGKLVYMAPEQILGEPVTRRTDIFSAAVVLWESLTGQRLFESESSSPLAARMKQAKIDPPSTLAPEVPPALDAVVMKGLALDSEARFATAREMAFALEEAVTPATQAQVAAWVEVVADKALAERAARIAQIESDGADSSPSIRKLAEDIASDRLMTKDVISSRSSRSQQNRPPSPTGSYRRATPSTPPPPSARISQMTGPMSDPIRPSRPPPSARLPPLQASGPDPYFVPLSGGGGLAPAAPASLDAPAIPTEHAAPAKVTVHKVPRRGVGAIVFMFLVIGLLGLVVASPFLAKKNVVENLKANGITATIDEADLVSQFGSMRLVGVTFT
ncbi:MAG TPA: serine/threonine-protein kinase, partial [Polyangiaceae bacterium]